MIVPFVNGWIAAQYTLSECPSKETTAMSSTGPVNRVERPGVQERERVT